MSQVTQIPTSQIIPGNNDRRTFNPTKLQELANSIRANGLAQPVTVRPYQGKYQIVAGERRFRAISQILGWPAVPCLVKEMSDTEAAAIMLVENTGRVDLNPIEEANAYQVRMTTFSWTVEQVSEYAGVSLQLVKSRLSLLKLADDIQHLVANGHFPIGHAQLITSLDHNRQRIAIRVYRDSNSGLSLAALRPVVSKLLEEQQQDSLFNFEIFSLSSPADLLPVQTKTITLTHKPGDTVNDVLLRYASQLATSGLQDEASRVTRLITPSLWGKVKLSISKLFNPKSLVLVR
jgi:ParB family chromosome partitioning protein